MSEFTKLSQRELRARAEYTPTCEACGWSSFSIEAAVRSGWWYSVHTDNGGTRTRCACPWCRARSRVLGHGDPAQLGLGL
jgi:hypothetical protein